MVDDGPIAVAGSENATQTCLYCADPKALRDLLPPKRCDYCRKWRCQFCTLKFPLFGVRKGLSKALKGNSRICIQCFDEVWQKKETTSSPDVKKPWPEDSLQTKPVGTQGIDRDSRGVSFVDSESTMGSERCNSIGDSSRRGHRGSMFGSERRLSMLVDQAWAKSEGFGDPGRLSFVDNSYDSDNINQPATTKDGILYHVASFLGLVVSDRSDSKSMNFAIDLWMSLFVASILLVITLADEFSLRQRLWYCVAVYGIFLTLHPWIHANESSRSVPRGEKGTMQSSVAARRKYLAGRGSRPVPLEYKAHLQEMKETLAYYLSRECPWEMVKTIRGGEIYEMSNNQTPYAVFKINVFIPGISVANFMEYLNSKDPRDRCVWNLNEANFEVIDMFDTSDLDDDIDVSICVNTQKSFLGGLVAPRDFCLLYAANENSICYASVEHPDVPVRPGTTRGHVIFSCFYCKVNTSVEDPEGFLLTYISQTDVGGNLPSKLLYNGIMDNMQKVTKVFQQAEYVFPVKRG